MKYVDSLVMKFKKKKEILSNSISPLIKFCCEIVSSFEVRFMFD